MTGGKNSKNQASGKKSKSDEDKNCDATPHPDAGNEKMTTRKTLVGILKKNISKDNPTCDSLQHLEAKSNNGEEIKNLTPQDDLFIIDVPHDGDCMFSSIADQPSHMIRIFFSAKQVHLELVEYIKEFRF